jgi:hypothetical protein
VRTTHAAWLGLCALVACDWFDPGRPCKEGAYSCDADKVRVCVPLPKEPAGADGPKTEWRVMSTCEDDPVDGPRTCGMVDGQSQCVAEGVDGGPVENESQQQREWKRVDVLLSPSGYKIQSISTQVLKGYPAVAASGSVAVVSYAGSTPRDAALVAIGSDGVGTAWVRTGDASRIALIDAAGKTVEERAIQETGASRARGLAMQQHALTAELPPTLRVAEPLSGLEFPLPWRVRRLRIVAPSAAELGLVGEPLGRLPLAASSALTRVAFVSDVIDVELDAGAPDGAVADAGLPAGGMDAGVDAALPEGGGFDASLAIDAALMEMPEALPLTRAELVGSTLWVNVTKDQRAIYEKDQKEREELGLDVVRRAAEAFAFVATVVTHPLARPVGSDGGVTEPPKLPTDFPTDIALLILARISPMLAPREGFLPAWQGLHMTGVQAKIAGEYAVVGSRLRSDKEAVQDGFASTGGSVSPTADFAEFLARASLGDLWPEGPCDAIRGKKLDEMPARLMVPIAKLEVLWGLGLLSRDNMIACIGELGVANASNGFVLHKPNGEKISMETEVEGVRAQYRLGEFHASGRAMRGNVSGVFDTMYREVLPGVIRLKPVVNARA